MLCYEVIILKYFMNLYRICFHFSFECDDNIFKTLLIKYCFDSYIKRYILWKHFYHVFKTNTMWLKVFQDTFHNFNTTNKKMFLKLVSTFFFVVWEVRSIINLNRHRFRVWSDDNSALWFKQTCLYSNTMNVNAFVF